jgi:hypothetical protein
LAKGGSIRFKVWFDRYHHSESFGATSVTGILQQFDTISAPTFNERLPSLWWVEHLQDIEDFES